MVITIIAVLTGLITAAAIMAKKTAMNARMKIEVRSLDQGLNAFKEQFGRYPPDGTSSADTQQFLANAFPRYTGGMGLPRYSLSPSNALSFWLGGLQYPSSPPTGGYSEPARRFSNNPLNPFDNNASRIGPFFNFESRIRLTSGTAGSPGYASAPTDVPQHRRVEQMRFITNIIAPRTRQLHHHGFRPPALHVQSQHPGYANLGGTYVNANSFTDPLPRPGRGVYGTSALYPPTFGGSSPASASQLDDITNFIKGATMKADMPD